MAAGREPTRARSRFSVTEAELLAVAASRAKQTTISWDEYLNRVRTNPKYDYKSTRWYKAGVALEQIKHLPPPPPPVVAPYGTKANAGVFAGRGIMLGSNPDVWNQALGLAKSGYLDVAAFIPSTPRSVIDSFPCERVIWCPPEIHEAADVVQAESQPEWNAADHTAPGVVLNWWGYGRLDNKVALVEAYYNEGWGVDFGIFNNYVSQGAKAVIPVCGGYHAAGRSDAESARLYQSLGTLPFPGFWMFAGESLLTPNSVAVLKAWSG